MTRAGGEVGAEEAASPRRTRRDVCRGRPGGWSLHEGETRGEVKQGQVTGGAM